MIYIRHCITKQDNLLYIIKTIYYIKIRKPCFVHARRGFYFPKKLRLCIWRSRRGFYFPQKLRFGIWRSRRGFYFPQKEYFCLKHASRGFPELLKDLPELTQRPGDSPGTTQGRPGGRGRSGAGRRGKSMVSRTRNHTLGHIPGSRGSRGSPGSRLSH